MDVSWTIKKAEDRRIDAFELLCWRRLLRVLWAARISNQSILKEISPEYSLEGLMLKLNLQYFDHLRWEELTHLKRLWHWEILKVGGEGDDRGLMVGWHHWLDEHELEQAPGPGDGQRNLACCMQSMGSQRVRHDWATELNWTSSVHYQFSL